MNFCYNKCSVRKNITRDEIYIKQKNNYKSYNCKK